METDIFETVYNSAAIKPQDYKYILKAHTRVDVPQATILLEKGKIAKQFYLIEKGLFRSFLYDYKGNEITTDYYCPNQIMIESFSLFQRTPSKESFQAISNGIAWKVEYDAFQELLNNIEGFREWGRTWATKQLFVLKQKSIDTLTVSARDRYLNLLKERPEVIAHSPLKYIASYLGVTDTSLSRIRKEISTL